ncbi:MAG: class II fructose-bisphosphate aldolase [bacterium]|nr:class II fructose-bisphosphate aldolase [bacterium]
MRSLREVISGVASGQAIGHFNVSNLEMLWGVARAALGHSLTGEAKNLSLPVIIGVSEGERDAMGLAQIVALVKSLRASEGIEIFLNADHTSNLDRAKEAIAAGFDAVLADGSKMTWEENLKFTQAVVEIARASGRDIIIEGELGQIGSSSEVRDTIAEELITAPLTTPKQALEFVKATGVDLLAPAVGNFHGMLRSGADPALNLKLIKQISVAAGVPLVLHGASGNSDQDIKQAIEAGVRIVHVSTELRAAYRDALKLSLTDNPDEVAPYKFTRPATQAVERVVDKKLRLFGNVLS